MSDFERGKYYNKKKYSNRDRNESKSSYNNRFFNKSIYNPDKDGNDGGDKKMKQPQIMIKTRDKAEEHATSPKVVQKEIAEVASKPDVVKKDMTKSAKLLEDGFFFADDVQEFLTDNSDFLVVGIVGPQTVGKSSIMSFLASDKFSKKFQNQFQVAENAMCHKHNDVEAMFRQATTDDIETLTNATSGIDIFITENRLILLDSQPFQSVSAENAGELQNLQHVAFLMSVCHLLIFTQDFFLDINHVRFLQTAEMLKPTISNNEEEYSEQFPHLMLLHNKAQLEDFQPKKFKIMQNFYKEIFKTSKMNLQSGLGMHNTKNTGSMKLDEHVENFNLFLLPDLNDSNPNDLTKFEELIKILRNNISGLTKHAMTHVQLTEKTWLVYGAKAFDHIKKSTFYLEYKKLLP